MEFKYRMILPFKENIYILKSVNPNENMSEEKIGFGYLILGILCILGAIYFIMTSFFYVNTNLSGFSKEENIEIGATIGIFCATPLLIIGMIILFIPYYNSKKNEYLKEIAVVMKGYNRISLSKLATKTNTEYSKIEDLILKCIDKGFVNGYIDPDRKEFVQVPKGVSRFQVNKKLDKKRIIRSPKPKRLRRQTVEEEPEQLCVQCHQPLLHNPTDDEYFCPRCE